MICVRCKIEETLEEEIVCQKCLRDLKIKFRIPKNQDPLDDPNVKKLLEDYEKSF